MKKTIYIILTAILGIIVSFLIHAIIEIPVIYLIVSNYDKYSLGLSWGQLFLIHNIFTFILFLVGLILGIKFGFKWWKYIYVDKKYRGKLIKIKD